MRRRGEKLNEAPRITLSTIHGAKGGRGRKRCCLTDLTHNTMKSMKKILMMRIDCSMWVQQGQKNICTSLDHNKITKDPIYDK